MPCQLRNSEQRRSTTLRFVLTLASAISVGCSSDAESADAGTSGPLYLAATRVWDDTTTTSYFHLVSSLDPGTPVDPKRALEVAGAAKLFAFGELGWFAIGGGEAPTITRYTLDDRGRLSRGDRISLQPFGVHDLWDTLYFVSPEKAYYPDTTGSQLIVWNPTTMAVTGTIPLPATMRAGYLSYYGLTPLRRGDKLIFSVGWFDWLENDTVLGETGLVVVDTSSDSVERFDVDSRCGGVTQAIEMASGDAYFVSSALAGASYRLARLDTEPCALRVLAEQDVFDPAYLTRLAAFTEGAVAGEPVPGGDQRILLRVFDETLASIEPGAHTWDLTGQSAWRWLSWDVTDDQVAPVSDLPPSTADAFWFRVDGKVLASQTESDYSATTLVNLSGESGPTPALTVPGFLQGIARIR